MLHVNSADKNAQNLDVPMEEDVLSDVVPSNIVSRQVKLGFVDYSQAQFLSSASQESEGGESEYDDEAAGCSHVEELGNEG